MASSSICETTGFEIQTGDIHNPPQEGLFILISKSTMAFLTGQSWHMLKSWYTVGGQV